MENGKISRLWWYLTLVVLLSAFCFIMLQVLLLPSSIAYRETGRLTAGYLLYAAIGIVASTPTPFIAVLMIYVFREKKSVRQLLEDIFRTGKPLKAVAVTGGFCLLTLVYALLFGTPNGSPWYMLPLGFLIMIPFVGIAEETGWRGLLQPELEKRMAFPLAVLAVAAIWYAWHLPIWLDPTSNHYGDSLIGFGITILIWAVVQAAIYRSTKSVIACAAYHAFVDAIGAVYDWNELFDAFPGSLPTNVFRAVWLVSAVVLCVASGKKKSIA